MTAVLADLMPWLQLLLVPGVVLLSRIDTRLAVLEARYADLERRLTKLEPVPHHQP